MQEFVVLPRGWRALCSFLCACPKQRRKACVHVRVTSTRLVFADRLCRNVPGKVTEQCFQRTPLAFAGDVSWLQHLNGTRYQIPMTKVTAGTTPPGSQWARNPVPGCKDKHGFLDVCGPDGTEYPEPMPGSCSPSLLGVCAHRSFTTPSLHVRKWACPVAYGHQICVLLAPHTCACIAASLHP